MPNKPQVLQVATLMERLGIAVGHPAVVYLMGVHAPLYTGMPPLPPYRPGVPCPGPPCDPGMGPAPGQPATPAPATSEWCPPRPVPGGPCPIPVPGPCVMVGTTVLNGVLAFAGADYIDLHVPTTGVELREVLIPYNAIGMVLPGGPMV